MQLDMTEACSDMALQFVTKAAGSSNASTITVTSNSTSPSDLSTPPSSQLEPDGDSSTNISSGSDQTHDEFDSLSGPHHSVKRYLLLCADSGEFHTSLNNIDLTDIQDDKLLWEKARESYRRIRVKRAQTWLKRLRMRFYRPQHLKFLEVNMLTCNHSKYI